MSKMVKLACCVLAAVIALQAWYIFHLRGELEREREQLRQEAMGLMEAEERASEAMQRAEKAEEGLHPASPALFDTKKVLVLPAGRRLEYAYCSIADSGVGLTLYGPGGEELWHTTCNRLGVLHSKYAHEVTVEREGDKLKVRSRGDAGSFTELIETATGKHLRRRRIE
jgi:hypothetical protein